MSIEERAEDIARRTLLISIIVRTLLDESGAETGMFSIPADERKFRALELLVKQKSFRGCAALEGLPDAIQIAGLNAQIGPTLSPINLFLRAFGVKKIFAGDIAICICG